MESALGADKSRKKISVATVTNTLPDKFNSRSGGVVTKVGVYRIFDKNVQKSSGIKNRKISKK